MDNFANHPKSIGEIRAEKEGDGSLWSPRDALIELLRKIDSGEIEIDCAVLVYGKIHEDKSKNVVWSVACPSPVTALGLLTRAAHRINVCMSGDDG
jgi:hypothetical protein